MPDSDLGIALTRVRRRWQWRSMALAIAIGGAVFAPMLVVALFALDASRATALFVALLGGAVVAAWSALANRRLSAIEAAKAIEGAAGSLDNLIVTAAELAHQPRPIGAEIGDEIERQAADRLRRVDVDRVVPLAQPIIVAVLVLIGCALLAGVGGTAVAPRADTRPVAVPAAIGATSFKLTVSPPAYTRRAVEALIDPVEVSVLAGSRVQIETSSGTVRDWIARASEGMEIRPDPNAEPRFLSIAVVPDAPPSLRIVTPGRDLAFAAPKGQVAINLESNDDLGLASMSLRFTKASGGGENVAFTEGDVPLAIERRGDRQWAGRAVLALDAMGLADGDILVYRATARDRNPQGAPAESEQYLIEIGKTSEIADAGFALPSEEKKYAISQQMVIYKTEQLLKGTFSIDQPRVIAIEQRMVRAEVVFLGGGEVEDELEEAATSDELTEGRMQNTGRAEMLRAINAMSRAEALLNEGRAQEALRFEREALASLERALDRRRYFLRTLPDRSRIDVTRRLTGTRSEARSWLREQPSVAAKTSIAAHRQVMRELVGASIGEGRISAAIAARVAAIDPAAPALQQAAVAIASAATHAARQVAVRGAMQAVTAHALMTLSSAGVMDLGGDALAGMLADELSTATPRRKQ